MSGTQTCPAEVASVFDAYTPEHRAPLQNARALIFEVAASNPEIGAIEEALRWGEPAYLTSEKKAGSTIRLGVEKASGQPAIFFNCRTTLVEEFRQTFGRDLRYSKNRAVLMEGADGDALRHCIAAALTYHLRAKA